MYCKRKLSSNYSVLRPKQKGLVRVGCHGYFAWISRPVARHAALRHCGRFKIYHQNILLIFCKRKRQVNRVVSKKARPCWLILVSFTQNILLIFCKHKRRVNRFGLMVYIYNSFCCRLLIQLKVDELQNLFWSFPFNFEVPMDNLW